MYMDNDDALQLNAMGVSSVQANPENDLKRANITCLVYSYNGNGMFYTSCDL